MCNLKIVEYQAVYSQGDPFCPVKCTLIRIFVSWIMDVATCNLYSHTSELDSQKARQILLPSLVFDVLMCVCSCSSAALLTRGFWDLCSSIERGKLSKCDRAGDKDFQGSLFLHWRRQTQ